MAKVAITAARSGQAVRKSPTYDRDLRYWKGRVLSNSASACAQAYAEIEAAPARAHTSARFLEGCADRWASGSLGYCFLATIRINVGAGR
jgi:hypothetical protein